MRWILLLFASASLACTAATTVTQSVVGPDGQPTAGQALIRISAPCKSGTTYVGDRTIQVKFTASVPSGQTNNFSVALIPNDTCTPAGTSYTVAWLLAGGRAWTETWLVPTSGAAVSVDSVVITTTPLPTWLIQWPQIAQGGAAVGQAPLWNGASWIPGYVTGTGAAWGAITGALSAQTDLWGALSGKVGTSDARLGDARTPLAHVHLIADVTGLQEALNAKQATLGFTAENVANRGVASGYASLDSGGRLPVGQLPATVPLSNLPTVPYSQTSGVQAALGFTPENVTNRGVASGYATLDSGAHLPAVNTAAISGDISKAAGASSATVTGIQGSPVASVVPVDGQMMRWNAGAGQWQPAQVRYTVTFAAQGTVTVLGSVHKLGTADITVSCLSADTPPLVIMPNSWSTDPTTFDMTITFASPRSGKCVLR